MFDCPPDCGGCSCHINPPCTHCVEHAAIEEAPLALVDDPIEQLHLRVNGLQEMLDGLVSVVHTRLECQAEEIGRLAELTRLAVEKVREARDRMEHKYQRVLTALESLGGEE
jgi:hypothetical protein